jgi:hypothetical protein
MPLTPLDVERCPDFHMWNSSDQLQVCPGGGKQPLLQAEKWLRQQLPNLHFRILPISSIIYKLSQPTSSINNGDRIPIENRRS